MTVFAASARQEIADFLSALLTVYVIVIIAWIVIQFVFAMGVRMPYSRWSNAILDFLRDVSNPWLNLFRRLPLRIGPLDLSPIVAIIVLQLVGGIVIDIIDRREPRAHDARGGRDGGRRHRARPAHQGARPRRPDLRRAARPDPRASTSSTSATRASRSASCRTAARC